LHPLLNYFLVQWYRLSIIYIFIQTVQVVCHRRLNPAVAGVPFFSGVGGFTDESGALSPIVFHCSLIAEIIVLVSVFQPIGDAFPYGIWRPLFFYKDYRYGQPR